MENPDKQLVRKNGHAIKKVFFIGNGCIECGTDPLINLLIYCEIAKTNIFQQNSTDLHPMHALSCFAAQERNFFNLVCTMYMRNGDGDFFYKPPNIDGMPGFLKAIDVLGSYASFRKAMGGYYDHCEKIKLKDDSLEQLAGLGIYNEDSATVTTNWDNSVWKETGFQNVCYLHGRCTHPMTMIFPTEAVSDNHFRSIMFSAIQKELESDIKNHNAQNMFDLVKERCLIDTNEYAILAKTENQTIDWLIEADEIYFCGLAFNIYDHELANSLAQAVASKNWKKVTIVNKLNTKEPPQEQEIERMNKIKPVAGILKISPFDIEFINSAKPD